MARKIPVALEASNLELDELLRLQSEIVALRGALERYHGVNGAHSRRIDGRGVAIGGVRSRRGPATVRYGTASRGAGYAGYFCITKIDCFASEHDFRYWHLRRYPYLGRHVCCLREVRLSLSRRTTFSLRTQGLIRSERAELERRIRRSATSDRNRPPLDEAVAGCAPSGRVAFQRSPSWRAAPELGLVRSPPRASPACLLSIIVIRWWAGAASIWAASGDR